VTKARKDNNLLVFYQITINYRVDRKKKTYSCPCSDKVLMDMPGFLAGCKDFLRLRLPNGCNVEFTDYRLDKINSNGVLLDKGDLSGE